MPAAAGEVRPASRANTSGPMITQWHESQRLEHGIVGVGPLCERSSCGLQYIHGRSDHPSFGPCHGHDDSASFGPRQGIGCPRPTSPDRGGTHPRWAWADSLVRIARCPHLLSKQVVRSRVAIRPSVEGLAMEFSNWSWVSEPSPLPPPRN